MPIMEGMTPNNYAFIDSQNLNLSTSKDQGWKLDFKRFRRYLADKYNIQKAFLFIGLVPTQQSMYKALQEFGYVLIFKPTLQQKDGKVKGNVDAEIVLHAMIELNNFDKAVIVSGDGDFHCLLEYLTKLGKLERLLVPNGKNYSALLRGFTGQMSAISDLREKLEFTKGK